VLAVAVVTDAAACTGGGGQGSDGNRCDRKIAFLGALTGDAANLGTNMKNGAQLAVQQYNDAHPDCPVELVEKDSQGDERQAPGLARGLVADDRLVGVVGPAFSGETEASAPIFQEAGVPIVTPSATRPSLGAKGWSVFHRAIANDDAQGPAAASYIATVLKAQKVFVIDDQSAYGSGLADVVRSRLGRRVVDGDKVQRNITKDFTPVITKVKASGATVVFYGGYYQEAGLLVKQMRQQGSTAALVGGDGIKDPGFVDTAGVGNAEGTVMTCPCAPASAAKGSFVADFRAAWGHDPGTYSDVAFDVANIFLQGIAAGNTSRSAMLRYLGSVRHRGVANTYQFTDTGELDASLFIVWVFKVDGGQVIPDQAAPRM